jgi:hypothetical protein
VKIKATCKRCGREVLAEQVIAAGGECPWDGEPFNADYALALIQALGAAEEFGTRLELALEQIADLRPAFTIDERSVLAEIRSSLQRQSQNLITQG